MIKKKCKQHNQACELCGKKFKAKRSDAKYCSPKHAQRAAYLRRKNGTTKPAENAKKVPANKAADFSDVQELRTKLRNRDAILDPQFRNKIRKLDLRIAEKTLSKSDFETEAKRILSIPSAIPAHIAKQWKDWSALEFQTGSLEAAAEEHQRRLNTGRVDMPKYRDIYDYTRRDVPAKHEHADPSSKHYSPAYERWLKTRPESTHYEGKDLRSVNEVRKELT